MSDHELAQAIGKLTPENLLSVFAALLVCQQSANHGDHGFPVNGGKLINLFSDGLDFERNVRGSVGEAHSSKKPDVRLRVAS